MSVIEEHILWCGTTNCGCKSELGNGWIKGYLVEHGRKLRTYRLCS